MGKGSSGSNTVTQNNQPPAQFMQGYGQALGMAQNAANIPYQPYPGQLVAGLSPDQQAGIQATEGAFGVQNPYINAASQYINNSNAPLLNPQITGLVNNATSGSVANAATAGQAGITGAMGQYNPTNLGQWQDPYTQQVVNATQAEFNNQNAQQAARLTGNTISQGAFGGNRAPIAQDILAGQEQLAQAPTIAGLENQGFQTSLGALGQQASLGLQGAEASGQLGLTGAAQQAALGMQGAGTLLGANEAQGWLASQGGYGMANLGNEALSTNLEGANALMGVGGLEQQQAQEGLNVPYEEYLAAQAYPFQTASFFGNIAEGLGSNAGGTSSTTYPGASVGSQVAGAGLAGAGLLGQSNAFGQNGWLTNAFGGAAAAAPTAADLSSAFDAGALGTVPSIFGARGGRIPHRAPGGGMPMGALPPMGAGVPDVAVSVVPSGAGRAGSPLMTGNYGTTSSGGSTGINGAQTAASALGDIASIAGIAAALRKGGRVPGFAAGGSPISVSVQPSPYGGVGIPMISSTPVSAFGQSGGGFGAVQDYLNKTQAGAFTPPAAAPSQPASQPAAPSAGMGLPGLTFAQMQTMGGAAPLAGMTPAQISAMSSSQLANMGLTGGELVNLSPAQVAALPQMYQSEASDFINNPPSSNQRDRGARGGGLPHRDDGGDLDDFDGGVTAYEPKGPYLTHGNPPPSDLESRVHAAESSGAMRPGITGDGGQAGGPMQIHQAALDDVNRRFGTNWTMRDVVSNPRIGKAAGDAYLEMQKERYGDDRLAAAAYNAGPGRVDQALAQLPGSTQSYVNKVAGPGGGMTAPQVPSAPSGPMGQPASPSTSQMPSQVGGDPWRAMMMAGLGIMGGRSPNAAANIGQGALEGLKVYEEDQNRRQSIANTTAYRQQEGQIAQQREAREAGHQQTQEQLAAKEFAAKLEQIKAQITKGEISSAQGAQRLQDEEADYARKAAQGQAHIAIDQQNADRLAKGNPNAATPEERRLNRINANARAIMSANPNMPWATALKQAQDSEGGGGAAPSAPSAPAAPRAPLSKIFGQ